MFDGSSILKAPIVRFAAVGAVSTAIDLLVYNVLLTLGVHVLLAGALGFFAGFANGYFFNSRYVFQKGGSAQYLKYFTLSVGGLGITELILHFLHEGIGENPAKLVAIGIVFFWNFLLSKYWAFR
jgi:putative flippase GtrA